MHATPNRLLRLAVALALVTVVVTACSSKDDGATGTTTTRRGGDTTTSTSVDETTTVVHSDVPAETRSPCKIVNHTNLEYAFGSPFDQGTLGTAPDGGKQCVWNNTDGPPVKTVSLTLTTGADVVQAFEAAKAGVKVDKVFHFGDDSYRAGTTVAVLNGSNAYKLSAFFDDSAAAVQGLDLLAPDLLP